MAAPKENKPVFTISLRNRTLQLTREGGGFIVLVLGVGLGAINTGNNLLYLILAMCCSLIAVSGILSELILKKLEVAIQHPNAFFAREAVSIFISLKNGKKRLSSYSIQLDIPVEYRGRCRMEEPLYILNIKAGATAQKSVRIIAEHRGPLQLPAVKVSTGFPFGFFIKSKNLPVQIDAVVFPPILEVPLPLANETAEYGEGFVQARGEELVALREFETGDTLDSVHWKSSAKTGNLRVKEFGGGGRQNFTVFLNLNHPQTEQRVNDEEIEIRIAETASLVYHLIRRGDNVCLKTHDLKTEFDNSEQHLNSILHYLALTGFTEQYNTPLTYANT